MPHERACHENEQASAQPATSRWVLASVIASVLALCVPTARGADVSQAQAQRQYDIPAGPLDRALKTFASQAGVMLSVNAASTAGKTSPGLKGDYTVSRGFQVLLSGSGLAAVEESAGSYSVTTSPIRSAASNAQTMGKIRVQADGVLAPSETPPAYAGGQVARGGRLGVLGNKDFMDTPFSVSSFTSELIQNQQTRYISDVVTNDASVSVNYGASNALDDFTIRGFNVANSDMLFNGMQGVAPSFYNSMMSEGVERVEVLKGPTALLNGNIGGLGGSINVVPKRAGDDPLLRFTPSYISDSQIGGHLDVGRRLGENKEFGVRFNGVHRDGDGPVEDYSRKSTLLAFGLDYRGERARVSADLGYQEQEVHGARSGYSLAPGVNVPKAPDGDINSDSRFSLSNPEVYYGMVRGEFDLTPNWTVYAAAGGNRRETQYIELLAGAGTIVNAQGDVSDNGEDALFRGAYWLGADRMDQRSLEGGVQGHFQTGPVLHSVGLVYSMSDRDWFRRTRFNAYPERTSSIYAPRGWVAPDFSLLPDPDDAGRHQEQTLSSVALTDTLTMLDERLHVILGARQQDIEQTGFNNSTGARTSGYEDDALTHTIGVVVRPWQHVSFYGSYIEGLEPGSIVGNTFANAGQVFPPYETEQYEAGVKLDLGGFGTTFSLYQISRPSTIRDAATNILSLDGEQRNRGIELNTFGEIVDGLRLLGGLAYIDAELTRTEGGLNDGKTAADVPKWRLVLGSEWDASFLPGLTLTGRVIRNESVYLDATNTRELPAWTRLDLGARYSLSETIAIRANVDNALDKGYWTSRGGGFFGVSDPRTYTISASFDF